MALKVREVSEEHPSKAALPMVDIPAGMVTECRFSRFAKAEGKIVVTEYSTSSFIIVERIFASSISEDDVIT